MSEENRETSIDEAKPPVNRKPLYIATAVVGILVLGVLLFWFWRSGESGKAVPPPSTVTFGDKGQADTGEKTLTIPPDQVDKIGLSVETVGETLSSEAVSVAATGVVQPNTYKETPVISLLGGVVRTVNAELGQYVGKGQTLAVIFSDDLAASQSRYLALQTDAQTARQNYERTAKLVKISPVSNAELDQALAEYKIATAELEEHHKHHLRASKLFEIGAASREELEQAATKLSTAEANLRAAKNRYDRAVQVAEINPVSRGEFEQAAVKRQTAESDLAAARQRLILLGLSPARVSSLRSPSQITSEIALAAPVSGTVTKRDVNQGEVVEANKELMTVTNLDSVWAVAQVYEKDLASLREGVGASVTTDAYPDRLFRGHVTYIDPNINPETRTAQVRVELDNPGRVLKIGMYVNVAFGTMGTSERTDPVVPRSAVQDMNDKQVVFLATDKPNVFVIKPVRLGKETNGQAVVLEGLSVGDKIVTEGSFLLRAEWLKTHSN
jgi:RND family efflux transporter MFP subunit